MKGNTAKEVGADFFTEALNRAKINIFFLVLLLKEVDAGLCMLRLSCSYDVVFLGCIIPRMSYSAMLNQAKMYKMCFSGSLT